MKIQYINRGGSLETLLCDCGNDTDWRLAVFDESGNAYECATCGEYTEQSTDWIIEEEEPKGGIR